MVTLLLCAMVGAPVAPGGELLEVLRRAKMARRKADSDPLACHRVSFSERNSEKCSAFEREQVVDPNCTAKNWTVPHNLFVSTPSTPPYVVTANSRANPLFRLRYYNDTSAYEYVNRTCGARVGLAYRCLAAPAYRADLFRYCALSREGGVYMDGDLALLQPLQEVVSMCSDATVGADLPQGKDKGKQMKILAGVAGAPIFQCMMRRILRHVELRYYGWSSLGITGPLLLHQCYEETNGGAVVTYLDTREAKWPFTGMRTRNVIRAFEVPNTKRHLSPLDSKEVDMDYAQLFAKKRVYTDACQIPQVFLPPPPPGPPFPPPPPPRLRRVHSALPPFTAMGRPSAFHRRARRYPFPRHSENVGIRTEKGV